MCYYDELVIPWTKPNRRIQMKRILEHPIRTTTFVLLTAALSFISYYTWPTPGSLPEEKQYPLQLPPNADIRPASDVEPGTFKIHVSLDELLTKSRSGQFGNPIVAYGKNEHDGFHRFHIQYWLPRNDGTFYYADVQKGDENWGHAWISTSWQIKNATLIATPVAAPRDLYTASFIFAGIALLTLYLEVSSELPRVRHKRLYPFKC